MVGPRSKRSAAAAIVLMAAAFVAALMWFREEPIAVAPLPGPGNHPAPGAPAAAQAKQSIAPSVELYATDDGELIVNPGLLHTIDFFLVERPDSGGIASLRAFLKSRLSGPAYRQAEQLAAAYQVYIKEYDVVLAAQNLHTRGMPIESVDLQRIASWAKQRQRLRQQIFGDDVARLWYENDDARLEAALDALRHPDHGAAPEVNSSDPRYAPSQEVLHREQLQHALHIKQVIDDATTSFKERAGRQAQA